MRNIKMLWMITFLSISLTSFSQINNGRVTGTVVDGSTKIVESATITLVRVLDSSVAKMSVANRSGNFIFEGVAEGNYFVSITAVGHQKGFSESFEINASKADITLKTIELIPVAKSIQAVTVVGKKPLIEQKLDRTIVNVEAAASNVGATALEVLEKSPGITVDKDGNISLKGKQGVQVYIDGRPSYLSGNDLANYLRNMNASQMDQIEIMTNPPAKFDAAGNSGVINIKTKKNKQLGYNGSVNLGYSQSRYARWNESINFNYRKNKVNLFANLGYSKRRTYNDLSIQRKFIDGGTKDITSHFAQLSQLRDMNESFNAKIGMDYFASKRTTFGIVLSGFNNPGSFKNNSDVFISDPGMIPVSETRASTANAQRWKNFSTNLNFRHEFDSTGREITADLDYLTYDNGNTLNLVNAYYSPDGMPILMPDTLLGFLPQNITIYSAKVDYVHPLKNGAKLEAGLKTSFVNTDNNAAYDSLLNGVKVRDIGRSNHFVYHENVNAAYLNYSRPLGKKFSAQLGLRLENTNAKGDQKSTNEKFKRSYTQLFPTFYLQYTANPKNTFAANYGRRINRPNYEDLNPFIIFLDRYTFEQGNPNLRPQFSHNIELSHTYNGFLTTTLNYTSTKDIINEVLEQHTDKNETFIKKSNIASQRQFGISMNAGKDLRKWWNANLWANVYHNMYEGTVNGDDFEANATTGQFNLSNQFKFNKGWGAELSGFYRTAGVDGVFKIGGFGMMNVGVSKQILKGKGSLRFSVRDLLKTQKINGSTKFSTIDATFQQARDSRVANLSFTYRFNKGKINNSKRRTGGATDESNRVKSGGDN